MRKLAFYHLTRRMTDDNIIVPACILVSRTAVNTLCCELNESYDVVSFPVFVVDGEPYNVSVNCSIKGRQCAI